MERQASLLKQTANALNVNTKANLLHKLNITSNDSHETDLAQAFEDQQLRQVASMRYQRKYPSCSEPRFDPHKPTLRKRATNAPHFGPIRHINLPRKLNHTSLSSEFVENGKGSNLLQNRQLDKLVI